jgi:hypothetical protein
MDLQKWEFEKKLPCYLRGVWKQGGWWYFYLYALAIKVPLGTWLLILLAVAIRIGSPQSAVRWRDEMVLLAPGVTLLVFVSCQTGFTHHLRYVLPVLPFVFIWLGQLSVLWCAGSWRIKTLVTAPLA